MSGRLLYLVHKLDFGGLQRQLTYMLQALREKGYRPEVVVWDHDDADVFAVRVRELGIPLHSLPSGVAGWRKIIALRGLIRKLRPDVLHCYTFYINIAARVATLGTRVVAVGSMRSDFRTAKKKYGSTLGKLNGRWPRAQVYNSRAASDAAREWGGWFTPRRIFVVRNAIDLALFRECPPPASSTTQIVGVGSIVPIKRWDRLVKATHELTRRGRDCHVRIIGDGPLRSALEQESRDLGVAERVTLSGSSRSIHEALSLASLLVHVSDSEGCPNAVMEAMACGRPVVAMVAGDIPDLVSEGVTGFVVPCGDDQALHDRLDSLVVDHELRARMGANARAKAEREFSLDRLVSETLDAYRALGWRGEI